MVPKILFVFTSCSQTLTGSPTGWYLPEAAHPYEVLSHDAEIDFAAPAGPNPPVDPGSVKNFTDDESVKFLRDDIVKEKFANAKKLTDVNPNDYDAIFYVGGHGPVIDLASDPVNIKLASEFYKQNKIVSAVCHGPAALVGVKGNDGQSIFYGKEATGFSNEEEEKVGKVKDVPFLLETRIKELGGKYVCADPWTAKVVVSGNLLTGQNPASAGPLGHAIKEKLQFDVLASSSTPLTPPSTPTGELVPEGDSDYPQLSLKRTHSWAFGRALSLPQQFTTRRHTQQPVRVRKRSGSTPSSSRFQLSPSPHASSPSLDATFATEPNALTPISTLTQPMPSISSAQSKVVPSRELGWIRKLYFLQVIFLFANWLYTVWKGLTRPVRDESRITKGNGAEKEYFLTSPETSRETKEAGADAVRIRQARSKASSDRTSYVRLRASSIINIALRPQTKPPTPSPLSQTKLSSPRLPALHLIPPDPPEEDELNSQGDNPSIPLVTSPTSALSPALSPICSTPPGKRTARVSTTRPLSPAKSTPLHTRKTLVLDLDETLIHSTTRPLLPSRSGGWFSLGSLIGFGRNRKAGHIVEVVMGGRSTLYHVYKRPFVDYFLRKVSAWYTLVIFTASMKEYADPVIDWLDAGRGIISLRFFREHCTQLPNGSYSKDLSILNEDLARICLIDNSPASYDINKANGIPIEGWTHDPNDEALLDLLPVLDSLRFTSDVRHILGLRGF
ncbi:NIF-domain-containing protein [Sanghuangporus baumii]|uniref:NIF-domain-containing protein n=1 Tax=Sanghuangporus baumii TaxID=108892 RepID=A0A9Q5I373_SANBA|nr:NIF-domain-containing protein [Sanghuangporus baumii]